MLAAGSGALITDAHGGYRLPTGHMFARENAVSAATPICKAGR
jgi:hypothetical protein